MRLSARDAARSAVSPEQLHESLYKPVSHPVRFQTTDATPRCRATHTDQLWLVAFLRVCAACTTRVTAAGRNVNTTVRLLREPDIDDCAWELVQEFGL